MTQHRSRILLVEDDPDHAALAELAFHSAPQYELRVSETLQAARSTTREWAPELILADFVLPDGRGVDLLRDFDDIPLVLLTSQGNEETAVQALKGGALDYVVKSEFVFAEMPRIAERGLREWGHIVERRQSERLVDGILNSLSDCVAVLDQGGAILHVNRAWRAAESRSGLCGPDVGVGVNYLDVCDSATAPAEAAAVAAGIREVVSGQAAEFHCEYADERNGQECWCRVNVTRFSGAGSARAVVAHADITERKREEQRARDRAVTEARLAMLSPRERQVVDLVADGRANKMIAAELCLSDRTVEKHRASAMKKLDVHSVAELVRLILFVQD